MKKLMTAFCCALVIPLVGGEREDLLDIFKKENLAANKTFQESMTTVDIVGSAGNLGDVAQSQYLRALEYKLRHTADLQDRLKLLAGFHALSREIQDVYNTPREMLGSIGGMYIYHKMASLFQQQTAVLMLDSEEEKRWQRIADKPVEIEGNKMFTRQGKGNFHVKKSHGEAIFEFILFPEHTFSFQNRDFAIINIDMQFTVSDDFSTVYLCELKDGKMQVHTKFDLPYFTRWELKNNEFVLYNNDNMQKTQL